MKKFLMVSLFLASATVAAPTAAVAGPYEECLLTAGCFFDSGTLSWVCPDPATYMLCVDM